MRDCNRLFRDVASELKGFVKSVVGDYGAVLYKFLLSFWGGMLAKHNVMLSEISRGTDSNTSHKKQIERFSDRLTSFFCTDLIWNYHRAIKEEINDRTIFCVDNTDATKPYGVAFEDMCKVRDGSDGIIKNGYEITNIVALTPNHKQPIPVYSRLFSYDEIDFVSNNVETQKALDCINRSFGSIGTKVFDRGYDDSKLMRYLINNNEKFVIRCKENRILLHDDKEYRMEDLVEQPATEISSYFRKILLTFKSYAVDLQGMKFNLVVVSGFGAKPMTLLTNLIAGNDLAQTVGRVYMLRWKIEETHRFEKEIFKLENFRVRKLIAIRNIVLLTAMLCGFIAIICEHQKRKMFKRLFAMSQTLKKKFGKNHLYFYSISRAIEILYRKYFSSS